MQPFKLHCHVFFFYYRKVMLMVGIGLHSQLHLSKEFSPIWNTPMEKIEEQLTFLVSETMLI